MKYMLMVLGKQADYEAMAGRGSQESPAWNERQIKDMTDFMSAINDDLAESGELVDAQGLAAPSEARLIVARDGVPVVSDGPYGETKEVLAGYWVVDCESIERVTEIAGRIALCPEPEGSPGYPVVVQPIMDDAGDLCR